MLFKIFRKNHTTANVELKDNNQLSALKLAAEKTADEFGLDAQTVQSSLFASAAQEPTILNDCVVYMFVTSDKKHKAHSMTLTFKNPIVWGNDRIPVDYMIVGVLPDGAGQEDADQLREHITDKVNENADKLDDIRFNDSELNKLNQSFTE
ncbi:PTS sugar transporter subunit IIA [Companilactobacillus bobalius]|uniref:PTS EIIA type-2 domain-containing protein n=2 Tax=Companilactobacillus bobalius TaxID=2801451 RepID=A0A202FDR6_9LACO|nr:PTS sugar transporter subunit IIA [Companilactobacillus bobalius]KAE9556949.1 hypothetical protein ATN92_16895 [Companilactobacillus bobalius]KRK81870.1 hypothetical protein FC78_GL000169 [Companilactobacillus bobalius DSM 19674]OVE98601.1 hypothetical protein LKACC16343_00757 [Companilactobacillus bobalius]GEO59025.1 hypothetical protein LBO01_21540 [Companilactobacillus paralimentarius]